MNVRFSGIWGIGVVGVLFLIMIPSFVFARDTTPFVQLETVYVNDIPVDIKSGLNTSSGDILLLPGWNFSRTLWCDSTTICEKAVKMGYRLIMPEMGKSIYASHYYPQTRKDWLKYPTLTWVCDTMIPLLQKKYGIFKSPKNYLVGLSTGARGVVMIAEKTGTLFTAGAALSGDYDQITEPKDNLITGVYGSISKFHLRWQTQDNPSHDIAKLKIPIYFGHASQDSLVPFYQTKMFYTFYSKSFPESKSVFNTIPGGHNFRYWNSEVDNILKYFSQF